MNTGLSKKFGMVFRFGIWSELSNLFRMFAELILLILWSFSLSLGAISWLKSTAVLVPLYLISHLIARLLHRIKLKMIFHRLIYLLWILSSLSISTNIQFFKPNDLTLEILWPQIFAQDLSPLILNGFWVLLFSILSILRGVQVARYPVNAQDLAVGLRINLVIFLIFAFLYARNDYGIFLPMFFLFLFFYLLSLSLARISDLSDSFGSRLPGFNTQWAAGISITALVILFIAFILSLVINLDVAQFLGKGLQLIVQIVIGAVVLITSPILLAVIAVVRFLFELFAPNLGNMLGQTELEIGDQFLEDVQQQITEATRIDPRLFIMLGVLVVLVIATVWQLKWKPWQRITRGENGFSETVASFKVRNPLKNLFPASRRRRRKASARSLLAAARVRRIYAQLMDLCEQMGKPRPRSVTPNEFLPRMHGLFPEHHADLAAITAAYVKVRYGELPETSKDITEVVNAWERINAYGKEYIDEKIAQVRKRRRFL